MPQHSLWPDLPVEPPIAAPVFRRRVTTELYTRPEGRLLERWREVQDSILFTADGAMTEDELAAAYVLTRHEGVRVGYSAWRAHTPGPYQRALLFRLDAGYAHHSADAQAWTVFVRTCQIIPLSEVVDSRCLDEP